MSRLQRLAKDVYLAKPSVITPSNSSGPRLIILLGWMDAQLKHISKYADKYSAMYPGASVMVVQTHQTAFYRSSNALRRNLEPVVAHIKAEYPDARPDHRSPILVHTFSNGGCFALSAVNELLSKEKAKQTIASSETDDLIQGQENGVDSPQGVPARAFIFDSCPGTSNLTIMIRAFTAPIRSLWLKLPASGIVAVAYLIGKLICLQVACALFRKRARADHQASSSLKRQPDVLTRTATYLNSALPPRPRLYLYSHTDLLIPPQDVERHAAQARQQGVQVDMHNFGKSMHAMVPVDRVYQIKEGSDRRRGLSVGDPSAPRLHLHLAHSYGQSASASSPLKSSSGAGFAAAGQGYPSTRNDSVVSLGTMEEYDEDDANNGSAGTGKNRRMMDLLNMDNAASGRSRERMASPLASSSSRAFGGRDDLQEAGSNLGHLNDDNDDDDDDMATQEGAEQDDVVPSAALNHAISAFQDGGERRGGRRGGLADQGFAAADDNDAANTSKAGTRRQRTRSTALDPNEYPNTPAFREIEGVLRRVAHEWPSMIDGTTAGGESTESKDFDPIALALGLLDAQDDSLDSFLAMKEQLDRAISTTLSSNDSNYRAYETSITTHNSTLQTLNSSQRSVVELRKGLLEAREKLEGKGREGLVGMYSRMSHLEEMAKILDEIEHFRSIPDRLEALLSEKRFLSAVVLLVRSLKTIKKPEMMEIGALTDLRSWLVMQESVLLEMLIEELHNHLYLKSFYCDVRWKSYTRGQSQLPVVDFGDDVESAGAPSHLEPSFHTSGRSTARLPRLSKLQRYLNYLSLRPSVNPLLDEPIDEYRDSTMEETLQDTSLSGGSISAAVGGSFDAIGDSMAKKRPAGKNPELDSFSYIESLMESLAVLGKLGYGLDAVAQRVQGEIFALVESTVEEVGERNDTVKTGIAARPQSILFAAGAQSGSSSEDGRNPLVSLSSLSLSKAGTSKHRASTVRLTAAESNLLEMNVETLRDLFWTLFSKLDAVLQGFRVAYEVAMRITERRDFKDTSVIKSSSGNLLFSLLDVWRPVQSEVRSLLHEYLAEDQSGTNSSRNPIVSVNEVLRYGRPRESTKQIFKFSDTDARAASKVLKPYEDDLNRTLRAAVPGLIPEGSTSTLIVNTSGRAGDAGGFGHGTGSHKALVPADAFNVSVLFGPTLSFLDRVKEVMPGGLINDDDAGLGGFGGFLDDFVVKTFLPQLEEKVSSVFHQAVGGIDAFQEDPNWRKLSPVPIVKSVSNLMLLISSLCSMLRATPFHRENYSHLIVSVIHQYLERCTQRFKELVSRDASETNGQMPQSRSKPAFKLSASWAEATDLNLCLQELREVPSQDKERVHELLKNEAEIEREKLRNQSVQAEDLISPGKKFTALGTFYSSLDWFILQIASLKFAPADSTAFNRQAGVGSDVTTPVASTPVMPFPTSSDMARMDSDASGGGPAAMTATLPLTSEMAKPFEALLSSYRTLASLVLFTMRTEVRVRTLHYLDKATSEGVYQLTDGVAEPDPSIVDLNSDIAEVDDCASNTLAESEKKFIFLGLSSLMDHLLVSNARHIRLMNESGLSKMQRNILALQQNLKNIGDNQPLLEVNFDQSRKFWDMYTKGPKEMLEAIRAGRFKYDFEEYKALLNLQCGVDQSSKDATVGGSSLGAGHGSNGLEPPMSAGPLSAAGDKSRRMYNEYLIDLFALDAGGD
ncbi:exocyst subunit [Microbotryomycetes sp. JL201]|nr:exocyst subunit [Microbotryomycetes sp. JL201]